MSRADPAVAGAAGGVGSAVTGDPLSKAALKEAALSETGLSETALSEAPAVWQTLTRAAQVLVLGHVNPDADAVGSVAALTAFLREQGVTTAAAINTTAPLSASLSRIPGAAAIDCVATADCAGYVRAQRGAGGLVIVTVDCAAPGRTGGFEPLLAQADAVVVIDHHLSTPRFGTGHVIDSQASSTTAVLARLFAIWTGEADYITAVAPGIAEALYAGLATDTGSFRWCSAADHRLAAALLERSTRSAAQQSLELMDSRGGGWLRFLATVLADATVDTQWPGGGLALVVVPQAAFGLVGPEDAEAVIDVVRAVSTVELAVVLKEVTAELWNVSLRSRSHVDVAALAARAGGGGHRQAAGFTVRGPRQRVVETVRALLHDA